MEGSYPRGNGCPHHSYPACKFIQLSTIPTILVIFCCIALPFFSFLLSSQTSPNEHRTPRHPPNKNKTYLPLPKAFHRDLSQGCTGILSEIWRVKPKLHIFGHVHWGSGTEPFYFDECQRAYESLMSRPSPLPSSSSTSWWTWLLTLGPFGLGPLLSEFFLPFVLINKESRAAWKDALGVIWYGVNSVLWKWIMEGPGSNNGGLFVNAAVMYGNTGRLRRPRRGKKIAVVVEL